MVNTIQKQSIQHSIVSYIGTIIGFVNVLFIYTRTLTAEEIGTIRVLVSTANLIVPFLLLGMGNVAIRYYPIYKDPANRHSGFLFFLLVIPFTVFILFTTAVLLLKDAIYVWYPPTSALITNYLPYTLLYALALLYAKLLMSYTSNFNRVTVPAIYNDLTIKLATPLLAIFYFNQWITFINVIHWLLFAHFLVVVAMFFYLKKLNELHWQPHFGIFLQPKKVLKNISFFALSSVIGGMGTMIATQIDVVMIDRLVDTKNVGIYTIPMFIAAVLTVPATAVFKTTAPVIATAIHQNNWESVRTIYAKSSINLLIVSIYLLVGIWACIDEIYAIIPNGKYYAYGKYVVLLLGISKIIDMATSVNSQIIGFSKYYNFNNYTILLLAFLNILFNFLLIPRYQLNGAAMASLLSLFFYNLSKYIFIKVKLKMQPFSFNTLKTIAAAFLSYELTIILPKSGNPFLDILFKGTILTILFGAMVLLGKFSEDINILFKNIWDKVKNTYKVYLKK